MKISTKLLHTRILLITIGFTAGLRLVIAANIPHLTVPPRTVSTNAVTIPDYSAQPTVPNRPPPPQSPAPAVDFLGLADNNDSWPPDTHGAVGPNHVVTMLNTQVRIQDRTGTILSTVTLTAFWTSSNIGSFTEVFDPRILYDPYGHRWIATAAVDYDSSNSGILIGVSTSDDPTGTWNLRRTKADANSLLWADFPMLGFNKDWIVVGANMWTMPSAGESFSQSNFYVYNKATLYAGNYAAPKLLVDSDFGGGEFPVATYDNTLATLYIAQNVLGNLTGRATCAS